MARTKSTPKRAPYFAPDVNTEILNRAATDPSRPYEPLQSVRLEEIQLQPQWTSAIIIQAQAAKKERDLYKAQDIITAALADRSAVSDCDVKWAMNIGFRLKAEVEVEAKAKAEAEARTLSEDSAEIIRGASVLPTAVRAPLKKANLAAFLEEDRESDKLSEMEDVSELGSEREQENLAVGVAVFCMALYLRHKQSSETT